MRITNLLGNLLRSTEDVRIILTESTDPSQSSKSPCQFIAVQNTEFGKADGKVLVRARLVLKYKTMSRTVHRLQAKVLVLLMFLDGSV